MQWAVGNVNYPRKKLSLSKEEAVPGGASVRYSPCKHSGHLSAWASWNSKICRLFVLEEVSIFSKGVLIQTTPVPATLAASSCLHVGPCFIRMLLFFARLFFLQASLMVWVCNIPVLQQGGRKTQRKWDTGTASREGLTERLGTIFSFPPWWTVIHARGLHLAVFSS